MDLPEAILSGVFGFGALLFALSRVQGRVTHTPETLFVVGVAFMQAGERGHRVCTVPHVALALLSDPDVAALLEKRVTSLEALYEDLERLLPARGDRPVTLKPGDHSTGIVRLLRARLGSRRRRPRDLLGQLVGSEHLEVRSVFEKHGITAASLREPPPHRKTDVPPSSESGPYRSPPSALATTDVLFWNDNKTSMPFVIETLRGVFGIIEPRAIALMLTVHREGVVAVGTYEREQAELLAATTIGLAKERGFPVKVTTAEARTRSSMGFIARWLHRRNTRTNDTLVVRGR